METKGTVNEKLMETKGTVNENQGKRKFEPWHELNDKVVMVTGSSSGLGVKFCLDLAKAGCRIIAAARRVDRLITLCDKINNEFTRSCLDESSNDRVRAAAFELDVSGDEPVIEARVRQAWNIFGRIDVLINNAGVRERVHGALDLSKEEWDNVIKINQTGTWLLSKHVSKNMYDSKQGGSIINISSLTGLDRVQFHGCQAYSASKSAINSLTKVMALELGSYNIRVNAIAPGIFGSEITKGLYEKPWMKKIMNKIVTLHTDGVLYPGLTSLARYLIHDSSNYVTGNVFIVEAGATLPGITIISSL